MTLELAQLYDSLPPAISPGGQGVVFNVLPVPGSESHLIGRDSSDCICILISATDSLESRFAPIRLESLEAEFQISCSIRTENTDKRKTFSILRCRATGEECIEKYFLYICGTILSLVGEAPSAKEVSGIINRFAFIFQKLQTPPSRSLIGLFGEVYLIWRSPDRAQALAAWHSEINSRFDFTTTNARLDVKTTSSRSRTHIFTYDQCNPPPGVFGLAASLFAEKVPTGTSLQKIINDIQDTVSHNSTLVTKLHDTIVSTLGSSLVESLPVCFDIQLSDSSLLFFDASSIPAIRGNLPPGVSEVRFRSELLDDAALSIEDIHSLDAGFGAFLPQGLR